MTKQEILEYFKDINHAYNESARLDDLSHMLDELMQSNSDEDCITCRVNSKTELDELKTELKNWKPELSELNHKLTFGECIIMAMSKITADLSEAAEKNWTEPQCEMLTRLICSVFMDKPYDEVTEEDMKQLTEDIEK